MRASLFDLHAAYEACGALTFIYGEGTAVRLQLEALELRIWRAIVGRHITTRSDAGHALRIVLDRATETKGEIGPDCTQLVANALRWFAERD